jgi:hypothetical protein
MIRKGRKEASMTATIDPIALEEARTDEIRRQADRANEARDEARRALVQATLDSLDERQQKPLLDRFVALQADAEAASAAVAQHEHDLAAMRAEQAARQQQAEVEAVEALLIDARQAYAATFALLEPAARTVQDALERMVQAQQAEIGAAQRMARLQGANRDKPDSLPQLGPAPAPPRRHHRPVRL